MGLVFLRISVAVALLAEGYCHRQSLPGWLQGATVILSIPLFSGFLTPIAAVFGLLLHGAIWFRFGAGSPAAVIVFALDAVTLALLGPGGYSVDAFRFGRRLVVLPPS